MLTEYELTCYKNDQFDMYFTVYHHTSFQVQGKVFLLSLGTINNCCFHPDVIPLVKQMNIVDHITPFLDKRSKRQSKDYFPLPQL